MENLLQIVKTYHLTGQTPLLKPFQKKEKELEVESADLIPLKIKLINFYFAKGDVSNVHKYLEGVSRRD